MKFQDYIQKHKYLLLIIAVLLIMILGKTNTEWNLLRTVWEILLPFLVGCIMAFILNIPMRFIEKRLFRNKSDSYRVSISSHCQLFINIAHRYYDHLADSVFYDSAIDEQFFHVE